MQACLPHDQFIFGVVYNCETPYKTHNEMQMFLYYLPFIIKVLNCNQLACVCTICFLFIIAFYFVFMIFLSRRVPLIQKSILQWPRNIMLSNVAQTADTYVFAGVG